MIGRSYDETGRLTHIPDHRGEQLHLRYGAAGKLEEIVASRELGMAITESLSGKVYEADPLHPADPRMLSRLVPSGLDQPVEYQFDELDRIVAILTTDGTVTRFEYNGFGEVLAEHNPMLGTTRYGYDAGGNRIWEARSDGTEIRRRFDAVGRVIRLEYQGPGMPRQEIQYRYDSCSYGLGLLCEVIAPGSVMRYEYDLHGNTVRLENLVNGHADVTQYHFSGAGRLQSIVNPSQSQTRFHDSYSGQLRYGNEVSEFWGKAEKQLLPQNSPSGLNPAVPGGQQAIGIGSSSHHSPAPSLLVPQVRPGTLGAIESFGVSSIAATGRSRRTNAFYYDSSCNGIPRYFSNNLSLNSAWIMGFRSFTVSFSGTLLIDNDVSVEVTVDVCYPIEIHQAFVFVFEGDFIYFGPDTNPFEEIDSGTDSEDSGEEESEPSQELGHDYRVDNSAICSTTDSWCTLTNIACWGRYYHALDKDSNEDKISDAADYEIAATNGAEVDLRIVGKDPIKVATGLGVNGHGLAQIPLTGHVFYGANAGAWGEDANECPQPVSDSGLGKDPPTHCNQVYREPEERDDGKIYMNTRGTGEHRFDAINNWVGPGIFRRLDGMMISAIDKALESNPGHECLRDRRP